MKPISLMRPEISGRTTTASFERSVPIATTSSCSRAVATGAVSTVTAIPPAALPAAAGADESPLATSPCTGPGARFA